MNMTTGFTEECGRQHQIIEAGCEKIRTALNFNDEVVVVEYDNEVVEICVKRGWIEAFLNCIAGMPFGDNYCIMVFEVSLTTIPIWFNRRASKTIIIRYYVS